MIGDRFVSEGKIAAIKLLRQLAYQSDVSAYFTKAFGLLLMPDMAILTNYYDGRNTLGLAFSKAIVEDIAKDL